MLVVDPLARGLPDPRRSDRSYLLCCTPRTGSWLLSEALSRSTVAGRPDEVFSHEKEIELAGAPLRPASDSVRRWLARIDADGRTENGVLGLKAHLEQLEHLVVRLLLLPEIPPGSPAEVIRAVYPGLQLVWNRRRDKVSQAVSWYRSLYSGVWFKRAGDPAPLTPVEPFDLRWVGSLHRRLLAQEAMWLDVFASFEAQPFVVDYEDLEADYPAMVNGVLDFLGLALPSGVALPPPRLEKQADALSEEIIAQYRAQADRQLSRIVGR